MLTEPIEIKMSAHEIALARLNVLYLLPLRKKSGWLILIVVFALSAAANLLTGGSVETIGELAVGFVAVAGSWLAFNYTRERGNKAAARMYVEGFTLTQREEGLLYQVGEAFEILPWAKFSKVTGSRRWIYLYFSNQWALIIPRTSFASDEKYQAWLKSAAANISKQEALAAKQDSKQDSKQEQPPKSESVDQGG